MKQASLTSVLHYLRKTYDPPRSQDLTDGDLLQRFLTGQDEAAFTLLLQRHGPMILGVCRRILGDAHGAEDAFQATFLVLVRRAASIRKKLSVGSWLHGVAQRIALRARAQAALRRQRERESVQMPRCESLDQLTWQELRTVMDEEIALLPEKYRAAIVLCHLEGKTLAQAAPELGWPRGSLANRLARARQLLRQRLARRGITLSAAGLAAALGDKGSAAELTALLTIRTVKVAASLAAGKTVASGCPSTHVIALAEEAIQGMPTLRAKGVLLLLALGLALGGAGLGAQTGAAPQSLAMSTTGPSIPQAGDNPAGSKKGAAGPVDLYGDPLPDGAIARLGTMRFRHAVLTRTVVFAQGGKVLASSGGNINGYFVCLWDALTGRLLQRLPNTEGSSSLAVSADGTWLVTGDRSVIDAATGKQLRRLDGPTGYITCLVCSPDGQTVAAAEANNGPAKVVLWDTSTGKLLRRLAADTDRITSVAFAPDSKAVASASLDGTVWLVDVATGKKIRRFEGHEKAVRTLAFARDGKVLASSGEDRTVRLWDVDTGKELRLLRRDGAVVASPDGKTLACAGNDGDIQLWDAATGKDLRQWTAYHGGTGVVSVAFSPDGKLLASAGNYDHAIRLWDVATGKEIRPTIGHTGVVRTLQFAADGKALVSSAADNATIQWDLTTGQEHHRLFAGGPLGRLEKGPYCITPDGKVLAVIGDSHGEKELKQERVIRLWDTSTGKELHTMKAEGARSVAFSADSKLVAADSKDGIHLWAVATGKEVRHLPGPPAHRGTVLFAPDDRRLAWAAEDRTIRVCEVATGKEVGRWNAGKVELLVFSPDGEALAGARKGEVCVWAALTGKEMARFQSLGWVDALAFSPSGRTLAAGGIPLSGADDATTFPILLWELWTGQEIRRMGVGQGSVAALAFSGNGRILASGGSDSTILLWDLGASPGGKKGAEPTPAAMDELWLHLGADAAKANRALWSLVKTPKESMPLLKERLRAASPAHAERVANLIAELDSAAFAARQKAGQALEDLGEAAEGAVRKALQGKLTLEVRRRLEQVLEKCDRETVRRLRAIETLEQIATPEARQLLESLSEKAVNPRVAQAAAAASRRLAKRLS